MNTAIANLLNKVLGDWIQDLNPDDLKVSFLKGIVTLKNLKVKINALDRLGLPFILRSGYVGKISVNISWTSITSSPLKIEISDVFVLLSPKPFEDWNGEVHKNNLLEGKLSFLENYELLSQADLPDTSNPGYVDSIIENIVDNLQISISRVYIRYEHNLTATSPFAIGVRIGSLSTHTTNSRFEKDYITGSPITYRLTAIQDLALYLDYNKPYILFCTDEYLQPDTESLHTLAGNDLQGRIEHRYILEPVGLELRLVVNKANNNDIPKIRASLITTDIKLGLFMPQANCLLKLMDFWSYFDKFQNGILSELKQGKLDSAKAELYREIYKEWSILKNSSDTSLKKKAESLREEMKEIERVGLLEDLTAHRQIIKEQLRYDLQEQSKRKEIEDLKNTQPSTFRKVYNFFSWQSEEDKQKEAEKRLQEIEEHEESLKRIIEEKEQFLSNTSDHGSILIVEPDHIVKFLFDLNIKELSFFLGDDDRGFSKFSIYNLKADFGMRPNSVYFGLKLRCVEILDLLVNSEAFPYLIKGGELKFEFDQYPKTSLKMVTERVQVIINPECIYTILQSLTTTLASSADLSNYVNAVAETTAAYAASGQSYLAELSQTGIQASIELEISLKAPVIYYPFDIHSTEKPMLVLDLGTLHCTNSQEKIKSSLYDIYSAKLEQLRLISVWRCDSIETWEHGIFTDFINPLSFSLQFKNCKSPASKKALNFIIKVSMSRIDLLINGKQVRFALKAMENLTKSLEKFPFDKLSLEESKSEVDSEDSAEILEVQALKDKMKEIGDILTTRVEVSLDGLSVIVSHQKVEILTFYMLRLNSTVLITSEPSVKVEFYLERIELLDRRDGIEYDKVICNPLIYRDVEDEYVNSSDLYQITGEIVMKPNQDLIDIFVDLNDLRVILSADLTSYLVKFYYSKLEKLEKYFESDTRSAHSISISRPKPIIKRQVSSYLDRRVSLRLSNFEVWVPTDPKDPNTKLLNLHFGINATYVIAQEYIKYYDDKWNQINISFLKTDDEATLEIIHLGIVIGYVEDDEVIATEDQNSDFLNPCRITGNFKSRSDKEGRSSNSSLDVNLESITVVVGFNDINFLMELTNHWSSIEYVKDTNDNAGKGKDEHKTEEDEERNDRIEVVIVSDALQITLVEDTGLKPVNLIHNELSNLNALYISVNNGFRFQLETIMVCNYFNLMNAAWEPLLEDWSFKILAKQVSPTERLECSFISEETININITYSMAETIATLLRKFHLDPKQGAIRRQTTRKSISTESELIAHGQFFYNIFNRLGVHISLWLDIASERWEIEPDSMIHFGQDYIDKLYSSNRLKSKNTSAFNMAQAPAAISIKVEGYKVVKGLLIENIEPIGFTLMSDNGKAVQCMLSFKADGIQRKIFVQTAHSLMNNTDMFVGINMGEQDAMIEPMECVAVPFKWLEEIKPPVVRCIDGLDLPINKNSKMRLADGYISLEILRFETSTEVLQTVYQFNPVLTFLNLFPGYMKVCIDDNPEPIITLSPGEERFITEINALISHKYKFIFIIDEQEISTEFVQLKDNESYYKLQGAIPASNIVINYDHKDFRRNSDLDLRFRQEAKSEDILSIKDTNMVIQAYPQYIINNHTDYDLVCGKKTKLIISAHSIGIFNSAHGHLAIRMHSANRKNKWSSNYNVNTAGVSGLITLDYYKNSDSSEQSKAMIGIRIESAPAPMIKTSIIHLVPRFMVLNSLEYPVYIRQYHREFVGDKILLDSSSSQSFQIQTYKTCKMIQISADGETWSSPFNIENLEDFQVRFPALPSQYNKENPSGIESIKRLIIKKTDEDWYKPTSRSNYMHYARVCIMTEDEATIFINFVTPKEPEFYIWNSTEEPITACQINCKEYLIPPKIKIPWAFDDLISDDKRILLKTETHSECYKIEKLKQKKKLGPYNVEVAVQGVIREMKIVPEKLFRERTFSIRQMLPVRLATITKLKLVLDIGGLGLSIIDNTPAEKFFFFIKGIRGKFKKLDEVLGMNTNTDISINMTVEHLQLDNMDIYGKLFPVILYTKDVDQDEPTPFFQAKIERNSSVRNAIKKGQLVSLGSMDRWSWLEIQLQEIKIQLNQESINQSLMIINKLMTAFDKKAPGICRIRLRHNSFRYYSAISRQ
jgi:hypothetical protein